MEVTIDQEHESLQNVMTCLEQVQVYVSLDDLPHSLHVRNHDRLFVALHALKKAVEAVLEQADFTER